MAGILGSYGWDMGREEDEMPAAGEEENPGGRKLGRAAAAGK